MKMPCIHRLKTLPTLKNTFYIICEIDDLLDFIYEVWHKRRKGNPFTKIIMKR
jgi:hypothetical protein